MDSKLAGKKKRKSSCSAQDGLLKYFRPVATSTSDYWQPMISSASSDMVVSVREVPNVKPALAVADFFQLELPVITLQHNI